MLYRGAPDEDASVILRQQLDLVEVRPEIATARKGAALVSEEVLLGANISRGNRAKQFVTLRGVSRLAYQVHRNIRLIAGHWPVRGNDEWVIGQKVAARYLALP